MNNHAHVEELDGIRGIAILLVLIGHAWSKLTWFAVSGLSLFFVLSGFLITGILLRNVGKPYYFSNFYARRALRIWPLYFAILAIAYLTPLFSFSHEAFPAYRFLLYIQNFWSLDSSPSILRTTGSLAIEEQFYLVWPLVILLCGTVRRVGWVAMVLIAFTPLIRVLYHLHGIDPYSLTFGRMDGLATGAGLAVLAVAWSADSKHKLKMIAICVAISLLLLPLSHFILLRKAFKDTSTNVFFGGVLACSYYLRGSKMTSILRSAPLRFFGKISYCAYLINLPIIYSLRAPTIVRLGVVVAISTASWYLFESQILKLKDRFTESKSSDRYSHSEGLLQAGQTHSRPRSGTAQVRIGHAPYAE